MGNKLLGIVLEAKKLVASVIHVGGELVLDPLPGGEVGGLLVAVLPDGAPGLEHGPRGGISDLERGGEAVLEDAADHEGVGLRVEGVELGGNVGLRGDEEGLVRGDTCRRVSGGAGGGVAGRLGGRGAEEDYFGKGKGGVVGHVVLVGNHGRRRVQMMMIEEEILLAFTGIHGGEEERVRASKKGYSE